MPRGAVADEIAAALDVSRTLVRTLLEEVGERQYCHQRLLAQKVANAAGSPRAASRIEAILRRRCLEMTEASPYPDAAKALKQLRRLGWKILLLSNAVGVPGRGTPSWYRLVDLAIHSYETGYVKPEPEAFRAVEASAGLSADQLIHVGNSWDPDVTGALGAGWAAVYLFGKPAIESHPGVPAVPTFDELVRLLGKPACK